MAKNECFVVVGIGEILWDLLPDGKQFGGAPANFAFHVQSLGTKSYVVSAVGDDELGNELLTLLTGLGLETKYILRDKNHPTGTVTVKLDEEGMPDYIIHENVAWDYITLTSGMLELARKADAICYGSLSQRSNVSRETITKFIKTSSPNCLRVFDVNIRQSFYNSDVIKNMLELSNVFKLNDDELPIVAQSLCISGGETEILNVLLNKFELKAIALTKGKKGSRFISKYEDSEISIKPIQVADSVGAGDAFTAGIVWGMLNNLPFEKTHEIAGMLASYLCSQKGATPNLPKELKVKLTK